MSAAAIIGIISAVIGALSSIIKIIIELVNKYAPK